MRDLPAPVLASRNATLVEEVMKLHEEQDRLRHENVELKRLVQGVRSGGGGSSQVETTATSDGRCFQESAAQQATSLRGAGEECSSGAGAGTMADEVHAVPSSPSAMCSSQDSDARSLRPSVDEEAEEAAQEGKEPSAKNTQA